MKDCNKEAEQLGLIGKRLHHLRLHLLLGRTKEGEFIDDFAAREPTNSDLLPRFSNNKTMRNHDHLCEVEHEVTGFDRVASIPLP